MGCAGRPDAPAGGRAGAEAELLVAWRSVLAPWGWEPGAWHASMSVSVRVGAADLQQLQTQIADLGQ